MFKIKAYYPFLIGFCVTILLICFSFFPTKAQQPVNLNVLMSASEAQRWKPYVEQFNQENPNINLKMIEGPTSTNQIEDLYTLSFLLGNSPYDLVYMDIIWVPKFAAAGWLRDVSDALPDERLSQFLTGDLEGGKYQGKLYRIPFRSDGGMLYYRKDWLEAAGYKPPETFRELSEIAQNLQEKGVAKWGYLWQGKQYEGLSAMFVEILQGSGAFWVNPDTLEVGLDQPEAIEAVKFLLKTLESGISPSSVTTYAEEETRRLFQSGNTVFLRNWPYVFPLANQEGSPIKNKFAIKPMVHAIGKNSGACQGGSGLGIASTSKHPDEALKVIEFFTRQEIQRQYILDTGYVPSLRSLFTDPQITAQYPYYPQLLEVVSNSALRPPIPQYAQASDILQRYLSAALTKKLTPETAMKKAAAETRILLNF